MEINKYLSLEIPSNDIIGLKQLNDYNNSTVRHTLGMDLMNNHLFERPRNINVIGENKCQWSGQCINSILKFKSISNASTNNKNLEYESLFIKTLMLYLDEPIYGFSLISLHKHQRFYNASNQNDIVLSNGGIQLFYGQGNKVKEITSEDIIRINELMDILLVKENLKKIEALLDKFYSTCLSIKFTYLINNTEYKSIPYIQIEFVRLLCFYEWFFGEFRNKIRNNNITKWLELSSNIDLDKNLICKNLNILNDCRNHLVHDSQNSEEKLVETIKNDKILKGIYKNDKKFIEVYSDVFQNCIILLKKITRYSLKNIEKYSEYETQKKNQI